MKSYVIKVIMGFTAIVSMPAFAEYPNVKLGVLTDLSGVYSDLAGKGSIIATQMAIDDCLKSECKGMKIDLVSADHQDKAEVAANQAREWFDTQNVDALVDLVNSATALAVQPIIKDKQKIALYNGPGTTRLTDDACAPGGIMWMYDTYALAAGTAKVLTSPGKKWFFIAADYAFGQSLQQRSTDVVVKNGGTVVGGVKHPLGGTDFSSYLLQAQTSKADVVGLANAGADVINSIKQAKEFGLMNGSQTIAGLLVFITDVNSLGLETAQGLTVTEGFYWDFDEQTRAWSKRFEAQAKKMPTMVQAGVYSSVLHYLKSVAATKSTQMKTVVEKMRSLPIKDGLVKNPKLLTDGRMVHDMYVFKVKKPSESKYPWDYYKLVGTIKGEDAFMSLAESKCPTK